MCGIAGLAGSEPGVIERMTECLVHRGPDGNDIWRNDRASLGHARLAILDPRPEGDQPMWNDDRTMAIVFNGEIFNYRELLRSENIRCKTTTDTEVVLRLFEKYGSACIQKLRGMFAMGIYNTKSDAWFLARDSKGIKPLFVAYPNGRLAFASEMRALMCAMRERPAINTAALSEYLRLQYVPGPHTLCEGIEQLPPGTILTWQQGQETREKFYPHEQSAYAKKEDFYEQYPALMDDVVRQHLVSDRPVGIFLSGGMDSSILLHHMAHHSSSPVKTFTVRFDATEEEGAKRLNTDADLAVQTARLYGTQHHEVLITAELYRKHYKETAQALDQPNADTVSVAQFLLAKEAKKSVDVVLTGAGGDELFGGYPRYRIARLLQIFQKIPSAFRGFAGSALGQPSDVLKMQPGAGLAERLLARRVEEGALIARGNWFQPNAVTELFLEKFADLRSLEPVRAFMEFDRHVWLVDESLRLVDATTMGSGLEARVPFVDERIIAAAHATPAGWSVTPFRTKALLKDTYRGVLPEHLFALKKASFFPPLAKWLRRECAPLAEEMLEHPQIREFFDVDRLRLLFMQHKERKGYHLHSLSTLIQLSHWFDSVYNA